MERLTHEADFGFEDWEETLFSVKSDPNGAYNILDIAKYQGEEEFDQVLINIALRLAAIENILGDDYDLDRLKELVEADRDGRCVVLPCKVDDEVYINIMGKTLPFTVVTISQITETPTFRAMHGVQLCFIFKSEDVGKTVFLTRESAKAALKGEQDG